MLLYYIHIIRYKNTLARVNMCVRMCVFMRCVCYTYMQFMFYRACVSLSNNIDTMNVIFAH